MTEFIVFIAILKGGLLGHLDTTFEHNFTDLETCKVFQKMVHSRTP